MAGIKCVAAGVGCEAPAVAYWHGSGPLGVGTVFGCGEHAPDDAAPIDRAELRADVDGTMSRSDWEIVRIGLLVAGDVFAEPIQTELGAMPNMPNTAARCRALAARINERGSL